MTEQPKPHAYCVTLLFDDGLVLPVPVIAPEAASATALCAFMAGRDPGVTGTITGIGLLELEADWLRQALRALEGGKPGAEVVSLVGDTRNPWPAKEQAQAQADAIAMGRLNGHQQADHLTPMGGQYNEPAFCPSHTWQPLQDGACPLCRPLGGAA